MKTRTVTLAENRLLPYRWRRSPRARHVGLRLHRVDGLLVTVPNGLPLEQVDEIVCNKGGWIIKHLDRFAALPPLHPVEVAPLPETIVFPSLDECWQVNYLPGESAKVSLTASCGQIFLRGAAADRKLCRKVLLKWLSVRAEAALLPCLDDLAGEGGFVYRRAQIRGQRSRWGSFSARGTISLNRNLIFLPSEQIRYVLIHELCHTIELNHSPRFWDLMRQHLPETEILRSSTRNACQHLPAWLRDS